MKHTTNTHLNIYIEAAIKLGINFEIIDPSRLVAFQKDKIRWEIFQAVTPLNNVVATHKVKSKILTNRVLGQANLPVPMASCFTDYPKANNYYQTVKDKYGIVVKPNNGMGGIGVTIKPATEDEFHRAFEHASKKFNGKVVIEEFIDGDHYRVLVLNDRVIDTVMRIPAYVTGDGKTNIRHLIENKNQLRSSSGMPVIKIDSQLEEFIQVHGFMLDSIPQKKHKIQLREHCNMSSGGETTKKGFRMSEYNRQICVDAVREMGLVFAGIDLITPSVEEPLNKIGGIINEVNSSPGLGLHYFCDMEASIEPAIMIQEYIYNK